MAFIPDEAIYDCHEISPIAWRIYCVICARRNHRSETTIATANTFMRFNNCSRAAVHRALKELSDKGWIERKAHISKPLKGDFSPMANRFNGSLNSETNSLNSETRLSQNWDSHHNNQLFKPGVLPFVVNPDEKKIANPPKQCNECNGTGLLWKDGRANNCKCQPTLFDEAQLQYLAECRDATERNAQRSAT